MVQFFHLCIWCCACVRLQEKLPVPVPTWEAVGDSELMRRFLRDSAESSTAVTPNDSGSSGANSASHSGGGATTGIGVTDMQ